MDDLGAEHLSELSVNDKNIKPLDIAKSPESIPPLATASATLRAAFLEQKYDNSETNVAKPVATPRNRHKDRVILNTVHHHQNEADEEETSLASSSDGREKTDATPENAKKIDDVIQNQLKTLQTDTVAANPPNKSTATVSINDEQQQLSQTTPNSTIADDDESSASSATAKQQQCLAFTIDFGDDSVKDSSSSVAAAAKYKSMVERFQNRHRRGASMSKIEGAGEVAQSTATPPASLEPPTPTAPPRSPRAPPELPPAGAPDTTVKVKMRARDRSTSRVKDATKRHSWSPRSSTTEPPQYHPATNHNHPKPVSVVAHKVPATTTKKVKTKPSNLTLSSTSTHPEPSRKEKTASNKPFTPRSTAMQMALQKIDFLCPQPPLDDYHHNMALNDNVSEAGTYTLDGDNYTEEQKDLMNIDKTTTTTSSEVSSSGNQNHHLHQRPKDLPLRNNIQTSLQGRRRNNVLEVNFYHDTTTTPYKPAASKTSYLEKIKSRVRNITAQKPQQQQGHHHHQQDKLKESSPPDPDVGTFTSVTTSGVLAKKTTLDSHPKLTRRSSLSTSQIDSSEYVSTEAKLKSNSGAAYNGGYTDHQKSGYRLNVFTTQTDAQVLSSAIESPESPISKHSDTGGLKTAQTKNDWIQEWARNARARSVASVIKGSPIKQSNQQQYDIMSRSYNCGAAEEDPPTDDSMIYRNKTIDRFRMGDFDYASDPNVSAQRPPKSPTKIPSPLHSIGRARSASHTRASLQNIIQDDPNNTDLYLQKTAAAISNLQQTLSRKNSIKSPPSSRDSPKKVSTQRHQYYSADEYSPQHSIEAKLLVNNPLHKRGTPGNNLMTNSYHEQLVLDVKIPRARKNSYDAQALTVSPARQRQQHQPLLTNNKQYYGNIDQTNRGAVVVEQTLIKQQQQQLSPLRRSSSFSTKCRATTTTSSQQKRPIVNNMYTPPTIRHNYVGGPGQQPVTAIKKSASSTTFRHVYSDYDDNVAYYINDEDDLVDVEYYGSSDEDLHSGNEDYEEYNDDLVVSESVQTTEVPLTNTRYNKALLMRIERSKQKVAGTVAPGGVAKSNLLSAAGVVACPNTPELPRRTIKSAPRSSMRQSMPRDSSLNRLAGHIPNSLASAKKQILQTANAVVAPSSTSAATNPSSSSIENANSKRIQPKYMDISKYKPVQGNNFLRKNDAKSTLKPEIRRSPSSASMGLSRTDATRASNRSVKSATSGRGTSASAAWRDTSVTKQKEVELAMWKRRAKYDPMRAAAEDRRKKEEAKKSTTTTMTTNTTQGNNNGQAGGAVTERKKPQLIVRWSKVNNVKYSNPKRYNFYNNNCIRSDGGSIVYVRQLRGHSHFTMVSDH
ncbi:uncharacterized protein LOC129917932 isoform X2 [Episyrphus balteatus]|uniref:uncharacterized protein LOC129917932 isoform X2 n=1 Tax=Episyrphus balteatus TaxID=286459 RepID=UPI002486608E|nr:uncharacterized protein LOC129917932 isoform X2 [Episyrphus balteatus]